MRLKMWIIIVLFWGVAFMAQASEIGGTYQQLVHRSLISSLGFSADGKNVIFVDWRGQLGIVPADLSSKAQVLPRVNDSFYALALSPDGRYAAAASKKGGIYIWRLSDRKLLYQFKAHMGAIHALAISADSLVLVSSGTDHETKLWNLTTSKPLKTFSTNYSRIDALAFIGSTYDFISGDSDNILKKWDFKTGQSWVLARAGDNSKMGISALAISADGSKIVTGTGLDLEVWDAHTGQRLQAFGRSMWIWDVDFFNHGQSVAATDGTDFRVCQLGVPVCLVQKIKGGVTVNAIAISPDQNHLMVGGEKGRLMRFKAP